MMRAVVSVSMLVLLAGCASDSSDKAGETPDYMAFCLDKEAQCKQSCSDTGVQIFSCRASRLESLEYRCECKRPPGRSI
jgi:type IV pilus biogenesis protein CpaD/CtpE